MTTIYLSRPTPRPIGFIDHTRIDAGSRPSAQEAQNQDTAPEDAVLHFDNGESVSLADMLHICLVLGTTGSGKTTSVLLPAVDGLIGRGFGGLVVDVKGSMAGAVRAIANRHGREADVLEIGPYETATPIDLLAGATAHDASELFRAIFMSHAAADERNQSFHTAGLAQAVDAWQILSARGRDVAVPFSLTAFDRILNDSEFATTVFSAFKKQDNLSQTEKELIRRIAGASAHVIPADAKTATQRVWREQVTYDMSAIRTGLRLFRASPGLERQFFATGGAALTMDRWVYDEKKIVVLRLSPATGEAGAGISRLLLRGYYQAVYDRGLGLPEGQCTFLLADEFQDVISTDPTDPLNDAAFVAKVREFRCATLLGTQSAIALAQRAHRGLGDVRTILGNCNVRIFLYSDEPETVSLAPATEAPLDELGPGQAVLVHYDAVARTHRHSTTGVNSMHDALQSVLAGAGRDRSGIAVSEPGEEDLERKRQNILAGRGMPGLAYGVSASTVATQDDIVEETPAEAALARVQHNGMELQYVPAALRTPEVCIAAVKKDGMALRYVPEALKTSEICMEAVQQDGLMLARVPAPLRTPELCLAAVMLAGMALEYVPDALKTPELCLEAVAQDGMALEFVPEKLKTSALYLAAVQSDGRALELVPAWLRTQEFCLAAVRNNGNALEFVPARLRTPEFCRVAVRNSGWALNFVPPALKTTELCLAAVRRSPGAATLLPDVLAPAPVPARQLRIGVAAGRVGGSRLAGSPCRPHRRRTGRRP